MVADSVKNFSIDRIKNPLFTMSAPRWTVLGKDNRFYSHEYDLYEYGRMIDTESFVSIAFKKKRTLMFKRGYELSSFSESNIEYLKNRISEIEYVTETSFPQLLREVADNLISFHNAYIVKIRSSDSSTAKGRTIGGQYFEPIAGYFCIPPEHIQVRRDNKGRIVQYRQYVSHNKYKSYQPNEIIHIYYNKRTGLNMGVPPLESVKDDILALRRIEESIETLIYKSLFPILHVKVGTEKSPAKVFKDGTHEVDMVTKHLRSIEDNGGITTSERVEIKAIGAESLALRVSEYLSHFKSRVFIGLGMSSVDFGEGDSTGRATGEVLSESLKESVMDYQLVLSDFVTNKIFSELLVDGGIYKNEYLIPSEDKVTLAFNELDFNYKLKIESHLVNCATQKIISINEAREGMGRKALSDQEIKKTVNQLEIEQPPTSSSSSSSGSSKLTKSIVSPKNQHSSLCSDLTIKSLEMEEMKFMDYSLGEILKHLVSIASRDNFKDEKRIEMAAIEAHSKINYEVITDGTISSVLDYGYHLLEEMILDEQV